MKKLPAKSIEDSYKNIVGGPPSRKPPSLKELDDLFSYEGKKYGDMPSYKTGEGGGRSLDRLAQMMGGQIANPYQYARMTSSGSSSGGYPYKSAIQGQAEEAQAKSASELQKMRGEQDMNLQYMRGEQEMNLSKFNKGLGDSYSTTWRPTGLYSKQPQLKYSA